MPRVLIALFVVLLLARPAAAEFELSVYSGWQTATDSDVEGDDPDGIGRFDFEAEWEGRSFEAPLHYGFRATWWPGDLYGYGVDFNHLKVYSTDETRDDEGFETLEFTDGLNILTANVYRRFPGDVRRWTPYLGAGLGVSIPYVEVETPGGTDTFEYQYTGPAAQWVAGVTYPLSGRFEIFGEYKGTFSRNEADLDGGGELETDILTNALNVGVSFNF